MNDIPAPNPDTVSIYLATPEGSVITDLNELYVSQVTVLKQGALIWVDPIGHIQLSEQVLVTLVHEHAKRAFAAAGLTTEAAS